jgi:phytoene dehydrogenase-like protein
VGFKPHQVEWTGKQHLQLMPKASDNYRKALHYECALCRTHMYEDASSAFGMFMLPARVVPRAREDLSEDLGALPPEFRPNHHIFYGERLRDVQDGLPKWSTVIQGQLEGAALDDAQDTRLRTEGHNAGTGQYTRHVANLSPPRVPEVGDYLFTTQVQRTVHSHTTMRITVFLQDPSQTHVTRITPEKVQERVACKYEKSPLPFAAPDRARYDVIIVGGGHNGLVAAAYLAKNGQSVLVLERRHIIGGAAVTEELLPGFKFSRASYLAGLLRPRIIKELQLEKFGFKYLVRDPSSFTPTKQAGRYLMMGSDERRTLASIAQFSAKDAAAYVEYERFLKQVRSIIAPLLDSPLPSPLNGRLHERLHALRTLFKVALAAARNASALVPFYELLTAPANYVLDRWFESEMLKTTLATDAVVGSLLSPREAGSAYILLHHVMGEAAGQEGVWAYVEGGMGSVSNAIAAAATEAGAHIHCNAQVKRITYSGSGAHCRASGVEMADGTLLHADTVLSNANPYHTFLELLPGLSRDGNNPQEESPLPKDFVHHIRFLDYSCGAFKINCAISELPNFTCCPSPPDGSPGPQHRGTIHFESTLQELDFAAREATMGMCVPARRRRDRTLTRLPARPPDTRHRPAVRPIIELTIPTSLDKTLAPAGTSAYICHLAFVTRHASQASTSRSCSCNSHRASSLYCTPPPLLSPFPVFPVFLLREE